MQIREVRMEDSKRIYELLCELENTKLCETVFLEVLTHYIQNTSYHCFVLEENTKIQGFVSVNIHMPLHHCEKIAEIQELIIAEGQRGKSYGKALMKHLLLYLQKEGCKQVEVTPNCKRKDAKGFYERIGFVHTHHKLCQRIDRKIDY